MADKSVMKKLAVSACLVCCGLNLAFIFGAGTLLTSFAVLSQPHLALITIGFALIGVASFLIWKRGRKAACCEVAKS
jgi:hypothetical protein